MDRKSEMSFLVNERKKEEEEKKKPSLTFLSTRSRNQSTMASGARKKGFAHSHSLCFLIPPAPTSTQRLELN